MNIKCVHENEIFNGENFHVFIYQKTASITGLHQHDYYEFTIVLTGSYFQEIDGKRIMLERGEFAFIPVGSSHQSFYEFGSTRILNVGVSRAFFDEHYSHLLPPYMEASQSYRIKDTFLNFIESSTASLNFVDNEFYEFIEIVTFYIVNRLRHYREAESNLDYIPTWLKKTIESMHEKVMFSDHALENMTFLSGKTQEYLTRSTKKYYGQTPMEMINSIRVNFAKKQLEITNYSITDIAYESGYSSPSLFIKNFKRLTSLTPSRYRKLILNIE
ncbi:transcriptional regulator ChbR [Vibrio mediterranei]|jgi:AraC family cel operon transcriptional repressor|uniref:transcriptional regulator ChbR n=1 Tax=Vibrio mediterranei TaxID=689 RepID=UPI001EFDB00D|nr:transcriptional regulator ChbR [Vibrio mediterranei]MCG9629065.1 transcriptional regulator ChbR [Vibrio mediterranei]MCY9855374.1 transcriptional regulator ChbR [Vibrio mediterranei]